jgi:hypothetical protein
MLFVMLDEAVALPDTCLSQRLQIRESSNTTLNLVGYMLCYADVALCSELRDGGQ